MKCVRTSHAEMNAILNSRQNLEGCTIYVALFPCSDCSKAIVQAGIKEVVYISDKYSTVDTFFAGRKILEKEGIKLRKIELDKKELIVSFENI